MHAGKEGLHLAMTEASRGFSGAGVQEGDWVPGGLEFTSCENWPKEWDLNYFSKMVKRDGLSACGTSSERDSNLDPGDHEDRTSSLLPLQDGEATTGEYATNLAESVKKWQPTPVFLPGESHGQRTAMGSSDSPGGLQCKASLSLLPLGKMPRRQGASLYLCRLARSWTDAVPS